MILRALLKSVSKAELSYGLTAQTFARTYSSGADHRRQKTRLRVLTPKADKSQRDSFGS